MQNPFYIQQPDLVEQYGRGYEIGAMQREDQKAQQAEAANAEMMQQFQSDLYSIYQNPEAGAREYGALQIKYPQMAESIKKTFESVDGEKQKNIVSEVTQVYSALQNGRPEYAVSLLREKADAARNSGDETQAKKYEDMAQMGELDPMLLKDSTGMTLYAIKGGDYLSGIAKAPYAGTEAEAGALKSQAEAAKTKAEAYIKGEEAAVSGEKAVVDIEEKVANIENTRNQIEDRAVKNDIELRKTLLEEKKAAYQAAKDSGIELDKDSRAFINEKAADASLKTNNANKSADLAARLDKLTEGGGTYQTIEQAAGAIAGWKDEEDAIRAEAQRVMTPIAMSNYKKFTSGATSDRDIETAMGGYPKPTDPPEVLASFLRGLDKMQRYDANLDKAMVGWTSNVGSLADAPRDFVYKGIKIPKGTSYAEFEQGYMENMIGEGAKDKGGKKMPAPDKLKGKSYMQGNW